VANNKTYSIEESLKSLEKDIKDLSDEMIAKAKDSVQIVAAQAHSMIAAKAQAKLKSTRQLYMDNLDIKPIEASGDNVIWSVMLYQPAKWIEDGQPAHNMLDYLLKSPKAKTAKDGHKYLVVPFKHNKPSNQRSEAQNKITNYVNKELKNRGLDKVITRDGKPVLGRAATLDLTGKDSPRGRFNQPLLKGLTIYQTEMRNSKGEVMKDKKGETRIRRDVMTFRVASERQKGSGLWDKPNREGLKAFEETAKEIDVIWEKIIQDLVK
jgi:hypothetical protein